MKRVKDFFNKAGLIGSVAILSLGLISCANQQKQEEDQTIRLIYANWSEGVATTYLAAELLESELGYDVVTKMTDVNTVFEQLSTGEYDVFTDAWLPQTHGEYMSKYGENLEDLSVVVQQVRTGLVVPDYVAAESISDLEGSFQEIIGIGEGAGIMSATQNALEVYDLDIELVVGDEQLMTESLSEAIKRRDPIVVTGWIPHWIFNRYELKFLDDPENVYGESEKIHTIARDGFTNDHSRASLFFERFELTDAQLGALMNEITALPDNERRAVRNWIRDNEFVVNRWVRGLQPEREKVM